MKPNGLLTFWMWTSEKVEYKFCEPVDLRNSVSLSLFIWIFSALCDEAGHEEDRRRKACLSDCCLPEQTAGKQQWLHSDTNSESVSQSLGSFLQEVNDCQDLRLTDGKRSVHTTKNQSQVFLFWPFHFFYWLSMTYIYNIWISRVRGNILFPQWEKISGGASFRFAPAGQNLWFCLGNKYLQVRSSRLKLKSRVLVSYRCFSFRLGEWSENILCSLFHSLWKYIHLNVCDLVQETQTDKYVVWSY